MPTYDHDWDAARLEFVSTKKTYTVVAKNHGIREGLMRKRAQREGWSAQRKEFSQQVVAKATEEVQEDLVKMLKEWNRDTLTEAHRLREAARSFFMRKRADGRWIPTSKISAQGLTAAASANMTADKLARLALGTSTENNNNKNTSLPVSVDEFV